MKTNAFFKILAVLVVVSTAAPTVHAMEAPSSSSAAPAATREIDPNVAAFLQWAEREFDTDSYRQACRILCEKGVGVVSEDCEPMSRKAIEAIKKCTAPGYKPAGWCVTV